VEPTDAAGQVGATQLQEAPEVAAGQVAVSVTAVWVSEVTHVIEAGAVPGQTQRGGAVQNGVQAHVDN